MWAATDAVQRRQGLRGVDELPKGIDGMVFVFSPARSATFGMLDARMALDIWWFDSNGTLLGGTTMSPCATEPCASFRSPGAVGWVLETPEGIFDFEIGAHLSTGVTG